jgi:hypothetical protein
VGLVALQAVLLAGTALDKADTRDEPHYLASSIVQWNDPASFRVCDAPALPKWGYGLALRLVDPSLFDARANVGRHPLWSRGALARRNLLAARLATILVTLLGGVALWRVGQRFGTAAGLVALALWCLSPAILAHGSLATLDGWATAGVAVCAWLAARAAERPTPLRAATLGAGLALAACSKVTALGPVPVALALVAVAAIRESRARSWPWPARVAGLWVACAMAFLLTLAAAYRFELARIDLSNLCGDSHAPPGPLLPSLPFAPWIAGILEQSRHGLVGHYGYLFGEIRSSGWWWFYLATLALKTTVGAQLLAGLRLAALVRARPARERVAVDLLLLAFPIALLLVMSLARAQNGLRYVLPAYPLLMLWGARAWEDATRAWVRRGKLLVAACLILGGIESVAIYPHYLMFFNVWAGGPDGGPRYLINGDDWGQDQWRLADWQRETRPWRLFYTPYTENPRHWGITFELPPCEPTPGYYALHAVEVHRPKHIPAGCLDWLTVEPPDERLGHSIYLYLVTRARISRLAEERARGDQPFWASARAAAVPRDLSDAPEAP